MAKKQAVNKFDKLIECVIANDDVQAKQIFHSIVVDKSRKIYEALDMEDNNRAFDEVEADHTTMGDEDLDEFGGDEADDLEQDVFDDEDLDSREHEEEEMNPEIDDRVADLETELDALKMEFEELLVGEEEGTEEDLEGIEDEIEGTEEEEEGLEDVEMGEEDEEEGDETEEDTEEEIESEISSEDEEEEEPVDESIIREYIEKVTKGLANSTEEGTVQKKSTVAGAGKNDIVKGVDAKNIVKGGEEKGRTAPTSKDMISEPIQNRPGGKAGVKSLKPAPKPVTKKEEAGTNTKSIESGKK